MDQSDLTAIHIHFMRCLNITTALVQIRMSYCEICMKMCEIRHKTIVGLTSKYIV